MNLKPTLLLTLSSIISLSRHFISSSSMLLSLVTLQVGVTSVPAVSMKHVTDNYRCSLRCFVVSLIKMPWPIKYWYFWRY